MIINKKIIAAFLSILISTSFSTVNAEEKAPVENSTENKKIDKEKEIPKIVANSTEEAQRFYRSDKASYKEASFDFFLNNAGRDVASLYYMGLITYNGEFTISKDEALGLRMIDAAAKSGYKDASLFIAKRNIESDSIEDKQKGLQLLLDPQFENDGDILYYLGQLYEEGKYVTKSAYYSERYYTLAAMNRNDKASYKMGVIYIASKDMEKQKEGWSMLNRAANNKNADACHIMVSKVKDQAINENKGISNYLGFLKCAANGGYPDDAKEYAYYLVTGKFVKYDKQEAYKFYKIYLENNKDDISPETYFQIGVLSVETGNKVSAEENLSKASNNGIANASYYIAKLFENGYWSGEPDYKRAKDYYERSGKQGRNNIDVDLKRVDEKINLITPNK